MQIKIEKYSAEKPIYNRSKGTAFQAFYICFYSCLQTFFLRS